MFQYGGFSFQIATRAEMIQECQRLRYDVYVRECGFEKPGDHPLGLETDAYDEVSLHALASFNGRPVGTARLILNGPRGLPIFHASPALKNKVNERSTRLVECSRLAVLSGHRQYVGPLRDGAHRSEGPSGAPALSQEMRNQSVVMSGLLFLLVQASLRMGLDHWIIIIEKKLSLHLRRKGIIVHPIGEAVDYHGQRFPHLCLCRELDEGFRRLHRINVSQFEEESLPASSVHS